MERAERCTVHAPLGSFVALVDDTSPRLPTLLETMDTRRLHPPRPRHLWRRGAHERQCVSHASCCARDGGKPLKTISVANGLGRTSIARGITELLAAKPNAKALGVRRPLLLLVTSDATPCPSL